MLYIFCYHRLLAELLVWCNNSSHRSWQATFGVRDSGKWAGNVSSHSFFTSVCQTFFCSLALYCIYPILYMSMVGVNHLFIVMKAKKMLVLSFLYIYLKHRWKEKPFNHSTLVEHILWTIIIVLSYKYSSNETIKSKKQRHEFFFFFSYWTTYVLGQYKKQYSCLEIWKKSCDFFKHLVRILRCLISSCITIDERWPFFLFFSYCIKKYTDKKMIHTNRRMIRQFIYIYISVQMSKACASISSTIN